VNKPVDNDPDSRLDRHVIDTARPVSLTRSDIDHGIELDPAIAWFIGVDVDAPDIGMRRSIVE
jgi:hypothetical protein